MACAETFIAYSLIDERLILSAFYYFKSYKVRVDMCFKNIVHNKRGKFTISYECENFFITRRRMQQSSLIFGLHECMGIVICIAYHSSILS